MGPVVESRRDSTPNPAKEGSGSQGPDKETPNESAEHDIEISFRDQQPNQRPDPGRLSDVSSPEGSPPSSSSSDESLGPEPGDPDDISDWSSDDNDRDFNYEEPREHMSIRELGIASYYDIQCSGSGIRRRTDIKIRRFISAIVDRWNMLVQKLRIPQKMQRNTI